MQKPRARIQTSVQEHLQAVIHTLRHQRRELRHEVECDSCRVQEEGKVH